MMSQVISWMRKGDLPSWGLRFEVCGLRFLVLDVFRPEGGNLVEPGDILADGT